MTEAQLELAILRKYVEHHDRVGAGAAKCERELDMQEVIAAATGEPADDETTNRWHVRLAPARPYPEGLLRPCTNTNVNTGPHRLHARAFYEPGRAPAWDRIGELEAQLPLQLERELEQKFGILSSPGQAQVDFAAYSANPGTGGKIGVLFIDIDDFKALNGRFTETVVDVSILAPFQELLRDACVHRGEAYRHGGEEFLVLLPNHTADEVMLFASRLRTSVEEHEFAVEEESVSVTVSIGIALWPENGEALADLIARANEAEHRAKNRGKNRVELVG